MRLFPPLLEIGPDEGFSQSKDIFKRKPIGDGLTRLMEASDDPLILAINGPWGTGKSTFLQMWAGELRKSKFPVIHFDAFAHDYIDDAFTAIAGEVIDLATSRLKPAASKKIKDAAISAGKVLIKAGAAVGVRAATAGILNSKDLHDLADDAKNAIGHEIDKAVEDALKNRNKQRKTINAFRESLSNLHKSFGSDEKPIIFIVDELDRCKPTFALAILERIKHFFAVPGVHFVFGVHITQLENSVRLNYGAGVDAWQYLQKFISITVELDVPGEYKHENSPSKYLSYLVQKMEFRQEDAETVRYTVAALDEIARDQNINLRSLEKIVSTLALALAYTKPNYMRPPAILAGLCVMKVLSPALYTKARRGTLSYAEVDGFFGLSRLSDGKMWPSDYFVDWWKYVLEQNADENLLSKFEDFSFRYNFDDRTRIARIIANNVIERFTRPSQ